MERQDCYCQPVDCECRECAQYDPDYPYSECCECTECSCTVLIMFNPQPLDPRPLLVAWAPSLEGLN